MVLIPLIQAGIMKSLIIEDELLAAERIQLLLKQYDASIEISGVIDSVEEIC